ncbi:MAG: M48 family metallopeptidase [Bacteroidota bacterium]
MKDVVATWYDGQSSLPNSVFLNLDIDSKQMLIRSDQQEGSWSLENLRVQISGKSVHIYNKLIPDQSIYTDHVGFGKLLLSHVSVSGDTWYYKMLHAGTVAHISIAVAVLGIILLSYLFIVPWIAERAVDLIPDNYDKGLGETIYGNYIEGETIDTTLTNLVQSFADQIDFGTSSRPLITVVNSTESNAFALPGEHIVIYKPILKPMQNYPELAALLSHEAAHIKDRHSMKMLCRNLSGYILVSAVFSDVNGIVAVVADNANQLRMLSYSRAFEKQADFDGFNILKHNKIAPSGMIDLFNHLKTERKNQTAEFLSTHPLTDERIKNIKSSIKKEPYQNLSHSKLETVFLNIKKTDIESPKK